MGRESREVWTKRVERWGDSGLSATEFAAEVGVNANTLQSWGWRLGAEQRRAVPPAPRVEPLKFVEVAAPTTEGEPAPSPPSLPAEKLELVLASGLLVRVPTRFEPEALRRLLAVVG